MEHGKVAKFMVFWSVGFSFIFSIFFYFSAVNLIPLAAHAGEPSKLAVEENPLPESEFKSNPESVFETTADTFQLPIPKRVGTFQHPVIYSDSKVRFQKTGRSTVTVLQLLAVRWGVHVYEIGDAIYECKRKNSCVLTDFIRLEMYESCKVRKKKLECLKPLSSRRSGSASGDIYHDDENGSENGSEIPIIHDTFDVEPSRPGNDDYSEFPERTYDPDWPVP